MVAAGSAELIALDGMHVRLGPWRGSAQTAYLAPLGQPRVHAIQAAMSRLRARGFTDVVTSAIAEPELGAFLELGFTEQERLHLLAHRLGGTATVGWRSTRRARPTDRDQILAIDEAAFEPFWRLDREGLADAVGATPVTRYRVTAERGRPTGYAIFGLAGHRGYLQRLAVHPSHAGHGLGSVLIRDGLRWLERRGAHSALVNTQTRNERALAVYLHHGFVLQSYQLVVLSAPLAPCVSPPLSEPEATT